MRSARNPGYMNFVFSLTDWLSQSTAFSTSLCAFFLPACWDRVVPPSWDRSCMQHSIWELTGLFQTWLFASLRRDVLLRSSAPFCHEGGTHPKTPSTQTKTQFAQTILEQFVQTVPPFPLQNKQKEAEEFAQTVCANCFYLDGWFFGWVAFLAFGYRTKGCS